MPQQHSEEREFTNSGIILEPPKITDWEMAGETGLSVPILNPSFDWSPYLPDKESQWHKTFDVMDCVSETDASMIATLLNYQLHNNLLSDKAVSFLKDNNYIESDNLVNISQRYIAKVSNTTKNGNTFNKVWDSIRKYGVVPEQDWPLTEDYSWDVYYKNISEEILNKGKKFLEIFDIKWDWIAYGNMNDATELCIAALQSSPVQIAIKNNGHSVNMIKKPNWFRDSYPDGWGNWEKQFTEKITWATRASVTEKENIQINKPEYLFTKLIRYGDFSRDVSMLQSCLKYLGYFKLTPTGFYGTYTSKAVMAFQTSYKVASTNEIDSLQGRQCGPKTIKKLNELFIDNDFPQNGSMSWWNEIKNMFKQ